MSQVASALDRGKGPEDYGASRAHYKYLAPSIALLVVLTILPMLFTLYLSTSSLSYTSPRPPRYIGLRNYERLLDDARFLQSIPVSLLFIAAPVSIQLALGFIVAVVMNERLPYMRWLRFVFVAPMVIPPIAMGLMWRVLYTPHLGGLNYFLSLVGIDGPGWLTEPNWALVAIIIVAVWGWTPFVGLFFLAVMQSIPEELFEAGLIDGATWVQSVRHITLPLLRPTFAFIGIFRVIESLGIFPIIYIVTNGGPASATETVNFYGFVSGFNNLRVGYASAIIVVFFLMLFVIVVPTMRFLLRNVQVGD
ncbi:MAG: sugar ABC transporter permease [Chloroflexi bacterium]|nr:sugar ABC transporter permease [Chloroflexota bacterium]